MLVPAVNRTKPANSSIGVEKRGQSFHVFDVLYLFFCTVIEFFIYFEKGGNFPCLPFAKMRNIDVSYMG